MKQIHAAFLAFALLLVSAAGCPQEAPAGPGATTEELYPPPFPGEANASKGEFATNLLYADNVYIIEDVRGMEEYPISKNNILQCAVDYAGSPGMAGKDLQVFAFDDGDICHTFDGETAISDCYSRVLQAAEEPNSVIIWIERGDAPEFYSKGLLVRINDAYVQGLCSVNFVVPESEAEAPAGGEPGETEAGGEAGPEPDGAEAA